MAQGSSVDGASGWLAAGAIVLAIAAAVLLLGQRIPSVQPAPMPFAQLENKEGLFPPPPSSRPDSGETYVYTPLSAHGAEQPRIGSPISPDAHPNPPPRLDDPPPRIWMGTPDASPYVGAVVWVQRPTARRVWELYPQRALRDGVGGRVQLDCTVQADFTLRCVVASESPPGEGFGRAALSGAADYRARPTLSDGTSAVGVRTRIAVNFVAPQ